MHDRLLGWFRAFLVIWACYVLAQFLYAQGVTDRGATAPDFNAWNPWHPFYFGVAYATAFAIPFFAFHLAVARRYGGWSSAVGRSIILLGTGMVLWGLGNFYWFVKNVQGTDAPYPSLADAGYLMVLPFAAAALWQLAKVVGVSGRDWRWLPLALLVAFPLNAYIMLPADMLNGMGLPAGPEAGTFDTVNAGIISSVYIVSDVVLLAMSIIIAVAARRAAGARFFAPVLAVTASLGLLYIGDIIFNYRVAKELFYNADVSDLLYGCFMVTASASVYLFLRADVRAARELEASQDDLAWLDELGADGGAGDATTRDLEPLDAVATAIVRGLERPLGAHTAHSIARSVSGIRLESASTGVLGGPVVVHAVDVVAVDALVRQYRSIAGPIGEMTSWTAARPVLMRHPELVLRSFDRFTVASATPASGAAVHAAR